MCLNRSSAVRGAFVLHAARIYQTVIIQSVLTFTVLCHKLPIKSSYCVSNPLQCVTFTVFLFGVIVLLYKNMEADCLSGLHLTE